MKAFYYKTLLLCFTLAAPAAIPDCFAQSWQWGESFGGVKSNGLYHTRPFPEGFTSLATDKNGNVYGVGKISDSLREIAGRRLTSTGSSDVLLASFNCDGQVRWTKILSGPTDADELVAVRCDTINGVYIAGIMAMSAGSGIVGNFDTDTGVSATPRAMFVVKYDTSGRYEWLRFPQPDTTSHQKALSGEALLDMDVTPSGDVHLFAMLATGRYGGSYAVTTYGGGHVLKYDRTGRFTGGVPLQLFTPYIYPSSYNTFRFMYDPTNDRYFQSGFTGPRMTFGTTITTASAAFIASWSSSTGALNWYKSSSGTGMTLSSHAVMQDGTGDIVIGGKAPHGSVFGGVQFNNPGSITTRPVVARLKGSDGSIIWSLDCQTTSPNTMIQSVVTAPDGRVYAVGNVTGNLRFPGATSLNISATDSTDILAITINGGTGSPVSAIRLGGTGYFDIGTCAASDRRNNLYAGGSFGKADMTVAGKILQGDRHGVASNLLEGVVAKFGRANCSCPLPAPAFTATIAALTARYTYIGSPTGLDSLVWAWGDGTRQTVRSGFASPLTHTFPTNSYFTTCVTAYGTACGSNTFCKAAPLDVASVSGTGGIMVSPNPTTGSIRLESPAPCSYLLFNTLGQLQLQGRQTASPGTIDLSKLPAGLYHLRTQDDAGMITDRKILRL